MKTVATWLHISDIHFRKRDSTQIEHLRDLLMKDIGARGSQEGRTEPKKLDAIFVTGDVAFSGGKDEYGQAKSFLTSLCKVSGLTMKKVFCVPGNHDVVRSKAVAQWSDQDRHLFGETRRRFTPDSWRLLSPKLGDRLVEYSLFESACAKPLKRWGTGNWLARLNGIDVLGINTALLAEGSDAKRLWLDPGQLSPLVTSTARIKIVLAHHPISSNPLWLKNTDELRPQLQTTSDLFLTGHLHKQASLNTHEVDGRNWLWFGAGATHSDEAPYQYALMSLQLTDEGHQLQVWPRRFVRPQEGGYRFVPDFPVTEQGKTYRTYQIGSTQRQARSSPRASVVQTISRLGPEQTMQTLIDEARERNTIWHVSLAQTSGVAEDQRKVFNDVVVARSGKSLSYFYVTCFDTADPKKHDRIDRLMKNRARARLVKLFDLSARAPRLFNFIVFGDNGTPLKTMLMFSDEAALYGVWFDDPIVASRFHRHFEDLAKSGEVRFSNLEARLPGGG